MFFRLRKRNFESNLLFIKDMVVEMGIGVYEQEKGVRQRVRINVIAEPSVWPNAAADNIADTVSYDNFVQIVLRNTKGGHIHLVETLAEKIAQDCLKENALRKITVRVEKIDIYPFAVAGTEITRVA